MKVSNRIVAILCICIIVSFSSCFKKDITVQLPLYNGSSAMQVLMGSLYDTCVYVNLDNASIVAKNLISDWDLRFDASANGHSVLMNSANHAIRIIKTNTTVMSDMPYVPTIDTSWGIDPPNQWTDSAYLRNWLDNTGVTKNEIYIVRQGDAALPLKYYKIKMLSVDAEKYTMQYDTINGTNAKTITILKNSNKNFTYFSFNDGGKYLDIEPDKTTWDIVFMPYHQPFYNLHLYYPVAGCLTNSHNTQSAGDTTITTNFNTFTFDSLGKYSLKTNVNEIGYNWKSPDNNFNYIVHPEYLYLVKTQNNHLYKLHFLDFYYQGNEKGAPKFEYKRLQ